MEGGGPTSVSAQGDAGSARLRVTTAEVRGACGNCGSAGTAGSDVLLQACGLVIEFWSEYHMLMMLFL